MELYRKAEPPSTGRDWPGAFRRQLEAVKDAARIEDVAADHGEFRLQGAGRLIGRCVSPGHEDRTPSMTVYTEEQRFRCFGCGEYGDVLDLLRLADPDMELWEAMMTLSQRYGIELPPRPDSWLRRQKRQAPVRDRIEAGRIEHVRLLVFRLIWMPWLRRLPEGVRDEAAASAWSDSWWIAEQVYAERRGTADGPEGVGA